VEELWNPVEGKRRRVASAPRTRGCRLQFWGLPLGKKRKGGGTVNFLEGEIAKEKGQSLWRKNRGGRDSQKKILRENVP